MASASSFRFFSYYVLVLILFSLHHSLQQLQTQRYSGKEKLPKRYAKLLFSSVSQNFLKKVALAESITQNSLTNSFTTTTGKHLSTDK